MVSFLISLQPFFLWYFITINLIYMSLILLGSYQVYFRKKEIDGEDYTPILQSNDLPEFGFIIPMYNEQSSILECVYSVLRLKYRYKKIIVINDGSRDLSPDILITAFEMVKIPILYDHKLKTKQIKAVYQSKVHPEIIMIDKENGRKFDAINAGLNASTSPYFIVLDADTYVDHDGFEALIRPILADPATIAVGAGVRIKNGCEVHYKHLSTAKYPRKFLTSMQGVEYLRAFMTRFGWNLLNANFIISGAFAVFPKDLLISIGGFVDSVGEDAEVIVRLHRVMKEKKKRYKIFYLSDPIAWTMAPETVKELSKQRIRWHLGLCETLWLHKRMFFNPRYGHIGMFVYPFWVFGELFEPVIELVGCISIFLAWWNNALPIAPLLILYIAIGFGLLSLLSTYCLFIEEISYKKYPLAKNMILMFLSCLVENLGYHQLNLFWRLQAFPAFIKKHWLTPKLRSLELP